MSNKELFYLAMAALGGYAAYLQIRKHGQKVSGVTARIFDEAFNDGSVDFYNQVDPLTGLTGSEFVLRNRLSAL